MYVCEYYKAPIFISFIALPFKLKIMLKKEKLLLCKYYYVFYVDNTVFILLTYQDSTALNICNLTLFRSSQGKLFCSGVSVRISEPPNL